MTSNQIERNIMNLSDDFIIAIITAMLCHAIFCGIMNLFNNKTKDNK